MAAAVSKVCCFEAVPKLLRNCEIAKDWSSSRFQKLSSSTQALGAGVGSILKPLLEFSEEELESRHDVPPEKQRERYRPKEQQHHRPNNHANKEPVALSSAFRLFCRDGRAHSQQVQIANVWFPPNVEQIADEWKQSTNKVDRDVQTHPQQRYLRNAITHCGNQDVQRHDRRRDITEFGNQIDDRVQPKPPFQNRNPKLVVHDLAEHFQLTLNLHAMRP